MSGESQRDESASTLKAIAGVARAPFLLLPVTLVAAGSAAAAWEGSFSWTRTVGALVGLITGLWFLWLVGWKLLPILALGAIATLGYTDFLARGYVGELAAGLGLGALPVLGTAMVQGGTLGPAAVAAAIPAFCMTLNLLLLNEFPDEAADRAGGRRNLLLLFGRKGAARIYAALALLVPLSLVGAVLLGVLPRWAFVSVVPSLLLARPLRWALGRPEDDVPIPALGANVVWNLATNSLLAASLAAAIWQRSS